MDIELAQALEENAKLKNENKKLNDKMNEILTKDFVEDVSVSLEYADKLSAAKELIRKMLYEYQRLCLIKKETIAEAEQFLIEPDDRFEVTEKGKEYLRSHKNG